MIVAWSHFWSWLITFVSMIIAIPHSLHADYLRRDLVTSHRTAFTLPLFYPRISRYSRKVVSISQATSGFDRSILSGSEGPTGWQGTMETGQGMRGWEDGSKSGISRGAWIGGVGWEGVRKLRSKHASIEAVRDGIREQELRGIKEGEEIKKEGRWGTERGRAEGGMEVGWNEEMLKGRN